MKQLETQVSEKMFLNRLISMCKMQKKLINRIDTDDKFVLKLDEYKFRVGHTASHPRGKGYCFEFLYGVYRVNDNKRVEIDYKFKKPFIILLPFIISTVIGVSVSAEFINEIINYESADMLLLIPATVFSLVGLFGLFYRSKKTRALFEAFLRDVCLIDRLL